MTTTATTSQTQQATSRLPTSIVSGKEAATAWFAVRGSDLLGLLGQAGLAKLAAVVRLDFDPRSFGSSCAIACKFHTDSQACCKAKKGVCNDADCKDGTYMKPVKPSPIVPKPADCKSWNPCARTFAPAECCRRKPATCYDPNCIAGDFVLPDRMQPGRQQQQEPDFFDAAFGPLT